MKRCLPVFAIVLLAAACGRDRKPQQEARNTQGVLPVVRASLDSLRMFDSEAALKKTFGSDISRSWGYLPEGMGQFPVTLLFAGTPHEVEFVWRDTVTFSNLDHLTVSGDSSRWRTLEGIALNTDLHTLEHLNGKSFTFYGFGWDHSGMVQWEGGRLEGRGVFVVLDYPGEQVPPAHGNLLGDHRISSGDTLARQANPRVRRISVGKK